MSADCTTAIVFGRETARVSRPSSCLCAFFSGEDVDGIGIDSETCWAVSKAVERLQSILEGSDFGRFRRTQPGHKALRGAGVGIGEARGLLVREREVEIRADKGIDVGCRGSELGLPAFRHESSLCVRVAFRAYLACDGSVLVFEWATFRLQSGTLLQSRPESLVRRIRAPYRRQPAKKD